MHTRTLCGLCAAFAASAVFADAPSTNTVAAASSPTNSISTNLPPVIVEASRLNKTADRIPAFVEVVSHDAIKKSGARDTVDLLSRQTGVFVRHLGGNNPALAEVSMRGFGENSNGRVLILVDGERLNNPDMSTPNLSRIPLQAIDHVEILHGPQTVLLGDYAEAGVINIVTDTKDYKKETTFEVHGGSWNTIGTHLGTRGGLEDELVAYWAAFDWEHSGGYRENSGYDIWSANGGVRKDWKNGSYLRFSTFYNDSQYDLPGQLTRDQWKNSPRLSTHPSDWARLTTYGLNTTAYGVLNDENALKLGFTASRRKTTASFHYDANPAWWQPAYDDVSGYDIYSYSITPQYILTAPVFGFANELTVGADLRWDTDHGYEHSYYTHEKRDYTRLTTGLFAQDEFFLLDNLSVVLGVRGERNFARNTLTTPEARDDNNIAYDAALNYRPVDDAKLYVRFTRFYRNPFLDEVPWGMNPAGNYVRKNLLAPERGWSVDVGGDYRFLKDFNVGGSLYAMTTENEVFFDALHYMNRNSPWDVRREGAEAHVGWERAKVAGVTLRYSLVDAEFVEGPYKNNTVPIVPHQQLSLDGRVYVWDEFFVFGGYRYLGDQYSTSDFANKYEKIDAFGLFSLGCQYAPECKYLKGFKFAFTVDNLFDKNYCDYSTYGVNYWPGAGRCYMFSVSYTF